MVVQAHSTTSGAGDMAASAANVASEEEANEEGDKRKRRSGTSVKI